MVLPDIIGSMGVALLLVAFFLNLIGKLESKSVLYGLLNTIGAALAATASYMINYWPFIILEGIWSLVSLVGLIRALQKKT